MLDDAALLRIAGVCAAFGVDGLRADIVIARAAAAHAAWRGATTVSREDIRVAARLALPHRRRRNPFDEPGLDEQELEDALGGPDQEPEPDPPPDGGGGDGGGGGRSEGGDDERGGDERGGDERGHAGDGDGNGTGQEDDDPRPEPAGRPGRASVAPPAGSFRPRRLEVPGKGQGTAGRRSRAATDSGRSVGARTPAATSAAGIRDVHLAATLAAAAPHQRRRGRTAPGLLLERADLREHRREARESNLVLFLVDASGSMAARRRMEAVKGAVLSLLLDAYQRRDKVGLVSFRGAGAELLLPPTWSADAAARRLREMPAGGRTPLAAGLAQARAVLRRERLRDPLRRPLLVVVTDGRHTAGGDPAAAAAGLHRDRVAAVVVDCESGPVRLGLAAGLAQPLGAQYLDLGSLAAPGRQASPASPAGSLSAGLLAGSVRAYRGDRTRPAGRRQSEPGQHGKVA